MGEDGAPGDVCIGATSDGEEQHVMCRDEHNINPHDPSIMT